MYYNYSHAHEHSCDTHTADTEAKGDNMEDNVPSNMVNAMDDTSDSRKNAQLPAVEHTPAERCNYCRKCQHLRQLELAFRPSHLSQRQS